jgi:predicted phosphoribosyltransferase
VCAAQPAGFFAVGQFYDDFRPISDREVAVLLDRVSAERLRASG